MASDKVVLHEDDMPETSLKWIILPKFQTTWGKYSVCFKAFFVADIKCFSYLPGERVGLGDS